jgi:hypothetical protein
LTQQIADIDFSNFCLMYTVDGVVNLLNQTMGSSNHKSKGAVSSSPMGNNSPISNKNYIKEGTIHDLKLLDA